MKPGGCGQPSCNQKESLTRDGANSEKRTQEREELRKGEVLGNNICHSYNLPLTSFMCVKESSSMFKSVYLLASEDVLTYMRCLRQICEVLS
jgi:hypothetical protein